MKPNVYLYILVMAGVTYLIRMLPLVLFKREITSPFVKSFLYYVPYACLAAMTFPAILTATAGGIISGAAGLIVAGLTAFSEVTLLLISFVSNFSFGSSLFTGLVSFLFVFIIIIIFFFK